MKKLTVSLCLTFCLIALLSGVSAITGQNVVQAVDLPWISVYPGLIDLGNIEMGKPFSAMFSVNSSGASIENPVWVTVRSSLTASSSMLYLTSPISQGVWLSGVVPETYGSFSYFTNVSGPMNSYVVEVKGVAKYPAPTNITAVYHQATSQLQFYCDPVPGAAKYLLHIWQQGYPFIIAALQSTSNNALLPTSLPTNQPLYVSVTALNSDNSFRSLASSPTPCPIQ